MSYYTHILICWEGGHVLGYADPQKIMSIADKYLERYKAYEREFDEVCKERDQKRARKEKLTDDDHKKFREIGDKTTSQATINILESIASGKAHFEGSKGDLWMSGGIFNYDSGWTVLDELKEFFKELWDNRCFGLGKVICFFESEQSYCATVIKLDVSTGEIEGAKEGEKWCWGLDW